MSYHDLHHESSSHFCFIFMISPIIVVGNDLNSSEGFTIMTPDPSVNTLASKTSQSTGTDALTRDFAMFRANSAHNGLFTGTGVMNSAVADGIVYFGSNDNNLYAVDTIEGKLKWKYTAENLSNPLLQLLMKLFL